jgi:hypothetical protein
LPSDDADYPGTLAAMFVITMLDTDSGNPQKVTSINTTDLTR